MSGHRRIVHHSVSRRRAKRIAARERVRNVQANITALVKMLQDLGCECTSRYGDLSVVDGALQVTPWRKQSAFKRFLDWLRGCFDIWRWCDAFAKRHTGA